MHDSKSLFWIRSTVPAFGVFFLIGGIGVSLMAVWGRFEHSPRMLQQAAWAFLAVGAALWMAGKSPDEPNHWRGACKALAGYLILASFLLYPILMSDGDFYYGVIRSILWDGDANTMNEGARFAHGWLVEQAGKGGPYGFPNHPFPIGASLSWIPFIAAGHVEAFVRRLVFDPHLSLNGYTTPYLNWVAVGTATWGGVFVVFSYLLARLRFSHSISLRAVVGALMATPGFYYCFRDCGFPHALSMAVLAFFAWAWLRAPSRCDWRQVCLLSIALSAAAFVRWQNCLFALAPIFYWISGSAFGQDNIRRWKSGFTASIGLGLMCLLLCFPQLVFFRTRGPSWLALQHGEGGWSWETPKFFAMFFDSEYGLFGWHPFYALAFVGACLFLARKKAWRWMLLTGWTAGWVLFAYWGESSPFASKLHIVLMLSLPLVVFFRNTGRLRPIALLYLCGGIELYINASYVLWHGGGEYGNRLVVDLLVLSVIAFAALLDRVNGHSGRWAVALAWMGCIGWSLALLWKGSPKFTRSPGRLTDLFSHGTPASSLLQGLAHWDIGLAFSGLWLLFSLALSLLALMGTILIARGLWQRKVPATPFFPLSRRSRLQAKHVTASFVFASLFVSAWFWVDLRQVEAALYLDNRDPWNADLIRQAVNTELVEWFPPGKDRYFPPGRERFQQVLSPATPEVTWYLPVTWPDLDNPQAYTIDKVAILSRVWAARDFPLGEPISDVSLLCHVPPSSTNWTMRAGVDTDLPTSLRLPPSSPDWYLDDVAAISRYFVAEFPAEPTQTAVALRISLVPKDVTLELGGIWLSKTVRRGLLSRRENARFNKTPEYDRLLFGQDGYQQISFPVRLNPDVDNPQVKYFPRPPRETSSTESSPSFATPGGWPERLPYVLVSTAATGDARRLGMSSTGGNRGWISRSPVGT